MDLVLGFDCCFDSCSVALYDGRETVASAFEPMQRGQAERLPAMAAEILAAAPGCAPTRVAVTNGPGTFTGVRIGLSFARAFALARGIPCIGVSSLEVAALAEGTGGLRAAAFPAAQGIYIAAYHDGVPILAPALLSLESARAQIPDGPILVAGAAQAELARALGCHARASGPSLPHAADLARLAYARPASLEPPHPLYLRAPDIRPSKRALSALSVKV